MKQDNKLVVKPKPKHVQFKLELNDYVVLKEYCARYDVSVQDLMTGLVEVFVKDVVKKRS